MEATEIQDKTLLALKEDLKKEAPSGRIPCAKARALAERHGVPYRMVGKLADELNIKIVNCELGCF